MYIERYIINICRLQNDHIRVEDAVAESKELKKHILLEAEASERHIESMEGEGRTISLTGVLLLEDTVIEANHSAKSLSQVTGLTNCKNEVTDNVGKPDLEDEHSV